MKREIEREERERGRQEEEQTTLSSSYFSATAVSAATCFHPSLCLSLFLSLSLSVFSAYLAGEK
jgi:hypothetical protein